LFAGISGRLYKTCTRIWPRVQCSWGGPELGCSACRPTRLAGTSSTCSGQMPGRPCWFLPIFPVKGCRRPYGWELVHGAIRALSLAKEDSGIACMAERLNDQLRDENSREFVTLFWAFYNPKRHDLLYVNAGHLPPLLVASIFGEPRRLETGGPVLGLLPKARYQEERITLDGNAYSDCLFRWLTGSHESRRQGIR
jgi:hypothetical protein